MKPELKKLLILNAPYLLFVYLFDKIGQAVRLSPGADLSGKVLSLADGFSAAFSNPLPSLAPMDLLIGIAGAVLIRLMVYFKGKNAKKYRKGIEYGSARWGNAEDIKPYTDPVFQNNVLLTQTERLTMNSRPKQPKYARNKNILVIGGSGSGKTRFFVKPNLMQMHSSYVVTDPKGTVLVECGKLLQRGGYRIKVLNTINFKKSMKYNPFAYLRSEKDILKLVNTLIANTKGDGEKAGEDFWVKSERLFYCALIGYIWYEAPEEEKNFTTLLEMINASEAREDDPEFQSPVDLMFERLEEKDPEHFAVRQYKKFLLSAGKTRSSILISCGARLAPFDLKELRDLMETDEMELDTIGDRKTALFVIISDTDDTAASLIDTIDGHFAEIQKAQDKEQTTEQAQPAQEAAKQPEAEAATPELPEETAPVQKKEAQPEQAAPTAPYYPINEAAAKRAKDMNSFSDYKQGSATAEYRHYVDEAVQLAARQKQRVDPMYHEKIDSLLDTYARKLAANMNKGYEIDARVPSILIAGGSNFPTRKKEKQNAARDSNYREWQDIQGLLDKIRSTGMGGISADDPQAVQKLEKKLKNLEKSQETMKAVNAYYRKHKTLDGCPHLPPEELEKLKADMASSWHLEDKPFATWALSNNSAEIRRVKDRIKSLSQQKEIGFVGWEFDGGKVEANTEANRLQIFFEDKPDEATREALKSNGFRWSPKAGAWQRQLTSNAYYAADYVKAIAPLTGEKPTELQRAHIRAQKVAAQEQPVQEQPEQEAPQDKDTFSIYQIKGGDETRDLRFEPYDRLTATGHRVDPKNYALVYSAELTPGTSLEDIYTRFNIDHPKDFKGHSLSVSDVVVLHQNGQDTAHYVDSFGYKDVPEFFKEQEKALIPDDLETGETIRTPRGTFYVTAMSREQMEAAGYGLHHQSDDGKYLIMGNGTRAFAVPVQPENYLKAAEQTTEQNYNMIDGQINNTPTVAELEAKVKAGETISLVDLAEAVKADKERGKAAKTEKKPSIRAQLRAAKEQTQKKQAKQKTQDLERS